MTFKFYFIFAALLLGRLEGTEARAPEEILKDPQKLLRDVIRLEKGEALPREEVDQLTADLNVLNGSISKELIAAPSPDWVHPTEERRAVIAKWGAIIQPFNKSLVEIGTASPNTSYSSVSRQALSLLDYTQPDSVLEQSLREKLKAPGLKGFQAINILREHRLLKPDDRDTMIAKGQELTKDRDKMLWALGVASLGSTAGLNIINDRLLQTPIDTSNIDGSITKIGPALDAARSLGPQAAMLLPGLEAKLEELNKVAPQYAGLFQSAIEFVKGERPLEVRYAVNGSGMLPMFGPDGNLVTPETPPVGAVTRPSVGASPLRDHSKPAPNTPVASQPKSHNWWLITGTILLLVLASWKALSNRTQRSNR